MKQKLFFRLAAWISTLALTGCSSEKNTPLLTAPGTFALEEVEYASVPDGTLKTWQATSGKGQKPFTFRIELLFKTKPVGNVDSPFVFTRGAFLRVKGADGREFMKDISQAIEGKGVPSQVNEREQKLEFSAAILGTSLSREAGSDVLAGGFTTNPSGNWIATKVFLADGEGEVYLNLNPKLGIGEFSIKDPEYAEIVLNELAKVFLP